MSNEADTCRTLVTPRLVAAGWDTPSCPLAEQRQITDGRIIPRGGGFVRKPPKRVDYLLRLRRDFPLAVVEAKASCKSASEGVQQARLYAEMLGLPFAYATNGHDIIECDLLTAHETPRPEFPTPAELWARYEASRNLGPTAAETLLTPTHYTVGKDEHYYQQIAINRAVEAIVTGRRRLLLTMATGTGKTRTAFQICWKLWTARWNRTGERRQPKILYLADRNILVDDPKDKQFAPFGDARHKIEGGQRVLSRGMYFATYQALAEDERRIGLFRAYPPDFFDLVIVDECHRGSAREDSAWRTILEWFEPAAQLGMTATPLREDNRDTYAYFGDPLYQYSLRQGIEDGFLAPYRVHRIVTEWDAAGWRPGAGDLDRYGRPIPDREYHTNDFERAVALPRRTEAIARHLSDFLRRTNRHAKTIVFCADQEHADEMRRALHNLNPDLGEDWVRRVTAADGDIGRAHLDKFKDLDEATPTVLTTSQLLTTGVDAPTCKNVVLVRVVGSMSEFKQIIGRGTRVRDDYGKLWFNILDYTGSATRQFADPAFDDVPTSITEEMLTPEGEAVPIGGAGPQAQEGEPGIVEPPEDDGPRKLYFDGGEVGIAAHLVSELDPSGHQLRVVRYAASAAEGVRQLYGSSRELRLDWADPARRARVVQALDERGIAFADLAAEAGQPEADPFDLLCHLAFGAPLRTRRERAARLRAERRDFFDRYGPEARQVLDELLEKYAEHGDAQFKLPEALKVPPLSNHGQVADIIRLFGGADGLRAAVAALQEQLYAA